MKNGVIPVSGLTHFVIGVDDFDAAEAFYAGLLGFTPAGTEVWPGCEQARTLVGQVGQRLVLALQSKVADLSATGVHQAYRFSPRTRSAVLMSLERAGIEVLTYQEDRPAEAHDNFYCQDPAGNRVQLVARDDAPGGPPALDHVGVQVADMLWAERFYTHALSLAVEHRVGWRTADFARAQAWADGKEDMAPGTRRMDKRYSSMVNRETVPRVNPQVYLRAGEATLAVYLANQHFQEPPEEQALGLPRTALAVPADALDDICRRIAETGQAYCGPTHHESGPVAASLYVRDPGGNFIEFAAMAEDAS